MKKIIKFFVFVFILLVVLVAIWIGINVISNEELNPDFHNFFYDDVVNQEENAFVALAGITAPKGQDILSYGKMKLASGTQSKPLKNELKFIGPADFSCWWLRREEGAGCPDKKAVAQSFKNNSLLLQRYVSLRNYQRFADIMGTWENGPLLMQLNGLFLAKMALFVLEGKEEDAIRLWLPEARYWQNVVADRQSIVGKSIIMVLDSLNIKWANRFLPIIFHRQPDLVFKYKAELSQLFDVPAFGKGGLDMASTMRAEKYVLQMLEKPDDSDNPALIPIKNKFYDFAKDVVWLSDVPAPKFAESSQILEKYLTDPSDPATWGNIVHNPIGNSLISSMLVSIPSFIKMRHNHMTSVRLLKLYIAAKAQNIPAGDMEKFIKGADPEFYNPLTGRPFLWDSERRAIFYDNKSMNGSQSARNEILY